MKQVAETASAVIARLDRATQYAAPFRAERRLLGVLGTPPSRGMTRGADVTTLDHFDEEQSHERAT
jgi:hypothetical protein